MSHLHRSILKPHESRLSQRGAAKDYTPLCWDKYFDEYKDVKINTDSFRIYLSGTEGHLLVLLHGGGYSALTWSLFSKEISSRIKCRILALDVRGHGETHTTNDEDLSIEAITDDVVSIIENLCENESVIFIGHSMGGALAVHCAHKIPNCVGLCVIDVVEGTALESLASMQAILRNRPTNFRNIEQAIQWCYRSGQTHNLESAKVSMPGQIKSLHTGKLGATEVEEAIKSGDLTSLTSTATDLAPKNTSNILTIAEESSTETYEQENPVQNMDPPSSYVWRINLSKTEIHWKGWFQGLSELFLSAPVPKLLLLANIHGLDTALTVGQMQGKFQLQVLPRCGHAIQEDLPHKVADIIAAFLVRHQLMVATGDFNAVFPAC